MMSLSGCPLKCGSFPNRGAPLQTPKYYSPYYRDPQNGTPNFGKLPRGTDADWDLKELEQLSVLNPGLNPNWVAVKELKLSYYIGETLLFTIYIYIYIHYGNLI